MRTVEVGRYSADCFRAIALNLDCEGRSVAWLPGHGWQAEWLALDPIKEFRVAYGPNAFETIIHWLNTEIVRTPYTLDQSQHWPTWIGYIAYEAARTLERAQWLPNQGQEPRAQPIGYAAVFRKYSALLRRDFNSGIVSIQSEEPRIIEKIRTSLSKFSQASTQPITKLVFSALDSDDIHSNRIQQALRWIASGDIYQVNVARCFQANEVTFPTHLLLELLHKTRAPFAAAIDFTDHALVSTSPELFFTLSPQGLLRTFPIKGTRPRGQDALSDRKLVHDLMSDPKEIAELTMVVDLERNDLGRIARIGSVYTSQTRQHITTPNIHHQFQKVIGYLPDEIQLGHVAQAMFPSGSVTGTPKIRAMELIATLEAQRRGIYSGTICMLSSTGSCIASMAIRTVLLDTIRRYAHYYVGGGIVADSDVKREVAETSWKAQQIHRMYAT